MDLQDYMSGFKRQQISLFKHDRKVLYWTFPEKILSMPGKRVLLVKIPYLDSNKWPDVGLYEIFSKVSS